MKIIQIEIDDANRGLKNLILPALFFFICNPGALMSGQQKLNEEFQVTVHAGEPVTTRDYAVFYAFDDLSIPATHNLRLTLSQPEKYEQNPILERGVEGEPDSYRADGVAVIREGNRWRMWYQAKAGEDSHVAYAESSDGFHWEKVRLGLREYAGGFDNNLVAIEPGVEVRSVLYDETAPPERRYVMLALDRSWWKGWRGDVASMTRIEVSPDGFDWTPLRDEPGIIYPQNKALTLYQFNGLYHLGGYQAYPMVSHPGQPEDLGKNFVAPRTFSLWRSPVLESWPLERTIAFYKPIRSSSSPYRRGWDREEVHLGAMVTPYPNVCLGIYGQWHHPINEGDPEYHGEAVSVDLGFLVSNDGLHFREPAPGYPLIERTEELSWDREFKDNTDRDNLLLIQGPILNHEDKTFIYYSATTPGGNVAGVKMNVGLATLPRDRFGSLGLIETSRAARFMTCPLETTGQARIMVNAEIPEGGQIRFSIVDESGLRELEHYSIEDSMPAGSGYAVPIQWKDRSILPRGQKIRIRAELEGEGTKIFSLYVSETK